MKNFFCPIVFILLMASCIPKDTREEMNKSLKDMQVMITDQQFQKTLGNIELHKLRTGRYPNSLKELKFQNALDSANFAQIEYHKLDSGYELNIQSAMVTDITSRTTTDLKLHYPHEFWKGLGCVKSNVK